MSKFLITGTAGFIGFHLAETLLSRGHQVTGLDNINEYYDIKLKYDRLDYSGISRRKITWNNVIISAKYPCYKFIRSDISDKESLSWLFSREHFDYIVHLAAQAGVRYSIENPDIYISSNITGFFNLLEACRYYPVKHLLYASSSSVYGNNNVPFKENDNTDNPVSLYAATKKSNELMAAAYKHLYNIPVTGLRLFTVYGPWGRPDMALFKFTEAILRNKTIQVYGAGKLLRDFTYIDDIVSAITSIIDKLHSAESPAIINIGHNSPVTVNELIHELEECLNKKAKVEFLPVQKGDVQKTCADLSLIRSFCNFTPATDLKAGIQKFCKWYLDYSKKYNIS